MSATPVRRALGTALALSALAFATGPASASASTHCRYENVTPDAAHIAQARSATFCLLNVQRRLHGLHPVAPSLKLRHASLRHSKDMVRNHFFAHGAYMHRIQQSGYLARASFWVVGENIAWGSGTLATPAAVMNMWMHSPPHRANILSHEYRNVGVGIAPGTPTGGPGGTYTTDFGLRG